MIRFLHFPWSSRGPTFAIAPRARGCDANGEERFYTRARDVSEEVVEARMLLGVHFRTADEDGAEIGRRIAARIQRRFFRPCRDAE